MDACSLRGRCSTYVIGVTHPPVPCMSTASSLPRTLVSALRSSALIALERVRKLGVDAVGPSASRLSRGVS